MPKPAFAKISIGPYVTLYAEDFFISELARFGMGRRGFRALCRSLGVPLIAIGKVRFVDQLTFSIAMRAVCRHRAPDFHFPGSSDLVKGRRLPMESRRLSPSDMPSLDQLVFEILASVHMNRSSYDPDALLRASRNATLRILSETEANLRAEQAAVHDKGRRKSNPIPPITNGRGSTASS